jgi:signal transduction histidine kinase
VRRPVGTVVVRREPDVVAARQRARVVAERLGFDALEQTRIATAVSELARNAFRYAGGGRVELEVEDGDPSMLYARVSDDGPGIPHLDRVLSGEYVSATGMGMGIVGARRLSDSFEIRAPAGEGTVAELGKRIPRRFAPVGTHSLAATIESLRDESSQSVLDELAHHDHETLRLLDELRLRQADVERLTVELEETNRGVMALYAELDDRAEELQRASEMKSRFLSSISHELRTPLTSVLNLTRLLLDRVDGPLSSEQEHQVRLIRQSVTNLTEMVNDLLDLARIEAGKSVLRLGDVSVSELISALRGMFRPVMADGGVDLVFEPVDPSFTIHTDEGKLSQILRNFIGNALKFTERGEVRVTVTPHGASVTFAVADTGVGIPPEHHERIFDEFFQVEGRHQARARGTGLGLPISRRMAELLGGRITLRSVVGEGSTFALTIPRYHPSAPTAAAERSVAVLVPEAATVAAEQRDG